MYAGEATDEVWLTMLDAYDLASIGTPEAPDVTTPTEGETVTAAPTIAWTSVIASGPLPSGAPARRLAAVTTDCRGTRGLLERITDAIPDAISNALISTAHAHKPPITGDIYYLELDPGTGDCAVTVLTTELTWTADAASWELMRGGSGTVTLTITSAYVTENRVTEGPYRPTTPRVFSTE